MNEFGHAKALDTYKNTVINGVFFNLNDTSLNDTNYIYDYINDNFHSIHLNSLCYNTGIIDNEFHKIYSNDIREITCGNDKGKQFRIYHVPGGFIIKESAWMFNLNDFVKEDILICISITDPQTLSWLLESTKHVKNCKLDINL